MLKEITILAVLLASTTTNLPANECTTKYVMRNNVKYMSDCEWIKFVANKNKRGVKYTTTINAESKGDYGAINRNDLGLPAYGIVQFRGVHARKLERVLGFSTSNSNTFIKRKLRSSLGKSLQNTMFQELYVKPTLKFANRRGITNKKVVALLVDARVNGFKYWSKVNKHTTPIGLLKLRKKYYKSLHTQNPKRYTKRLLRAWYARLQKFDT